MTHVGRDGDRHFLAPVNWPERIIAFLAAALLVLANDLDAIRSALPHAALHRLAVLEARRAAAVSRAAVNRRGTCAWLGAALQRSAWGRYALTLAWTHSIEKTRWEEDYGGLTTARTAACAARGCRPGYAAQLPAWSRRRMRCCARAGTTTPQQSPPLLSCA